MTVLICSFIFFSGVYWFGLTFPKYKHLGCSFFFFFFGVLYNVFVMCFYKRLHIFEEVFVCNDFTVFFPIVLYLKPSYLYMTKLKRNSFGNGKPSFITSFVRSTIVEFIGKVEPLTLV